MTEGDQRLLAPATELLSSTTVENGLDCFNVILKLLQKQEWQPQCWNKRVLHEVTPVWSDAVLDPVADAETIQPGDVFLCTDISPCDQGRFKEHLVSRLGARDIEVWPKLRLARARSDHCLIARDTYFDGITFTVRANESDVALTFLSNDAAESLLTDTLQQYPALGQHRSSIGLLTPAPGGLKRTMAPELAEAMLDIAQQTQRSSACFLRVSVFYLIGVTEALTAGDVRKGLGLRGVDDVHVEPHGFYMRVLATSRASIERLLNMKIVLVRNETLRVCTFKPELNVYQCHKLERPEVISRQAIAMGIPPRILSAEEKSNGGFAYVDPASALVYVITTRSPPAGSTPSGKALWFVPVDAVDAPRFFPSTSTETVASIRARLERVSKTWSSECRFQIADIPYDEVREWNHDAYAEMHQSLPAKEEKVKRHALRVIAMASTRNIIQDRRYNTRCGRRYELSTDPSSAYYSFTKAVKDAKVITDHTQVKVHKIDCIKLALQHKKQGLNPVVLSMANADAPGGGYRTGDGAQEEDLFRRTNYAVALDPEFSGTNSKYPICGRSLKEPEKEHEEYGAYYSKNITVFRDEEDTGYRLVPPKQLDFIAMAVYRRDRGDTQMKGDEVVRTRRKVCV